MGQPDPGERRTKAIVGEETWEEERDDEGDDDYTICADTDREGGTM